MQQIFMRSPNRLGHALGVLAGTICILTATLEVRARSTGCTGSSACCASAVLPPDHRPGVGFLAVTPAVRKIEVDGTYVYWQESPNAPLGHVGIQSMKVNPTTCASTSISTIPTPSEPYAWSVDHGYVVGDESYSYVSAFDTGSLSQLEPGMNAPPPWAHEVPDYDAVAADVTLGDAVAWADSVGDVWMSCLYDSGVAPCDHPTEDPVRVGCDVRARNVRMSDHRIVFDDGDSVGLLEVNDLTECQESVVVDDGTHPDIHGDLIVYDRRVTVPGCSWDAWPPAGQWAPPLPEIPGSGHKQSQIHSPQLHLYLVRGGSGQLPHLPAA